MVPVEMKGGTEVTVHSWFMRPYIRGVLAILLGILLYWVLPKEVSQERRLLVSWNAGALFLLAVLGLLVYRSSPEQTYHLSQKEVPQRSTAIVTVNLSALFALVGTAYMLGATKNMEPVQVRWHLTLSMCAVVTAWLLVHSYFALYYARVYYDETEEEQQRPFAKGLEFPNVEIVDYSDFFYYSFTIGMCYQTSDVTITGRRLRRVSLIHAIISFLFVAGVLGLVVNIIASLL